MDDADLLALLDEEPQDTEFCTCTVKCEAGNINENCPLCEKSLRNCTAPEAVKTDTETPQEKPKSNMGSLMILLVLALYNKPLEYAQMVLKGEMEHYLALGCDHGRLED